MANKKVCDWCGKEVGIDSDGYALGELSNFVYTIKTSLTYYNPRRNDLPEQKEKPIDSIEICDDCYHKHVKPMMGWGRELIVYPHIRVVGEALNLIHNKLNEEWEKRWNKRESTSKYHRYLDDMLKKIGIESSFEKDL